MNIEPEYATEDVHGNELTEEEKEALSESTIEIDGFAKKNWKSAEARDHWKEILSRAATGKDMAEWKSVLSDKTDRKAAIVHVNNYNREKWLKRVGKHGLAYRDIRYTAPHDGFAHKFHHTSKTNPERVTYAVVAESEDIADKMEEAELEMQGYERHNTVGELLNFPQCCRDFFWEYFGDREMKDPMYEIACNSESAEAIDGDRSNLRIKDPNPAINILWRYFGWSLITHMPCCWECEKSVDVARKRWEIMAENGYEKAANALYKWMGLPAVWTGKSAIMHIRNRNFIGSAATSDYWGGKRIVWEKEHEAGGSIV